MASMPRCSTTSGWVAPPWSPSTSVPNDEGTPMASVTATVEFPAPPEKVWATMSDPNRYEEWLTIHQGWRGEIPEELSVGIKLTEIVSVMGMANKIEWTVDEYEPPSKVKISGTGMAGVQVA